MPRQAFAHVETFIFDLDNTLYPPRVRLFDQIEVRMTAFVMNALGVTNAEADHLRRHYWQEYGTTLAGLMREHGVDPGPYLDDVHDISFSALEPDAELAARIDALDGRKIVYTNGPTPYARRVLEARGLSDSFEAVYGIEEAGFRPKPERAAFDTILSQAGVSAESAAMFEDDARNLEAPKEMGMRTVHVAPAMRPAPHVDFHTDDLGDFLGRVLGIEDQEA